MGNIISNLKVKFGVESKDLKAGLKDGERAVGDFKKSAGSVLDEFARMFGVNMSAVNDAIGTAGKSLNFLGQSFSAASKSGQALAITMKVLKTAMIATGIGALVVALGSLITYFKSTGEGADKFAVIMAKVRSVLDNIIDRFQNFGSGLADIFSGNFKEGWEKMRTAFKGIGEEIKEDWKLAGDLAKAEDALYDKETALILSLEQRKQKVAELREESRNLELTEKERLNKVQEAEAIIRTIYADQVELEKERLRIMREKLRISASDPTDEQLREVVQQEATINTLLAQQSNEIRTLSRERNTLVKAVEKEAALMAEMAESKKNAISPVSIDNIKMPDFSGVVESALMPFKKLEEEIKDVTVNISNAVNTAFENMAVGMGEFLGDLFSGEAGIDDFGKMVAGVFADMAINVGKIAIATGMAVLGVKEALKSLNPWVAIAAGVALVAIGSAVKGALANVASGGSGSASYSKTASSNEFVYDLTNKKTEQAIKVEVTGKLIGEGNDLVSIITQETSRRNSVT